MTTKLIYDSFKSICATHSIPEINSFYFSDIYNKNDEGNLTEYPKVFLITPLRATETDKLTTYNLNLSIVNVYSTTFSTIKSQTEKEVEIIDYCEGIWISIWNKLVGLGWEPRNVDVITIHEEGLDRYSGLEINFQIQTGNNLCQR